jgi:hypothetical protein
MVVTLSRTLGHGDAPRTMVGIPEVRIPWVQKINRIKTSGAIRAWPMRVANHCKPSQSTAAS